MEQSSWGRCEEAFLEKRDSVWQKVAGLLNQS